VTAVTVLRLRGFGAFGTDDHVVVGVIGSRGTEDARLRPGPPSVHPDYLDEEDRKKEQGPRQEERLGVEDLGEREVGDL
jgi:hypothetical protein